MSLQSVEQLQRNSHFFNFQNNILSQSWILKDSNFHEAMGFTVDLIDILPHYVAIH